MASFFPVQGGPEPTTRQSILHEAYHLLKENASYEILTQGRHIGNVAIFQYSITFTSSQGTIDTQLGSTAFWNETSFSTSIGLYTWQGFKGIGR